MRGNVRLDLGAADPAAAGLVLASFDPGSFLLHINQDDGPFTPEHQGEWASTRDVFETLPTALLAHEMCHVLHWATTAAGARQFMLSLDLYRLGNSLIEAAAASSHDQTVAVPLLSNAQQYADDDEFASRFFMFRRVMSLAALFHGGTAITAGDFTATSIRGVGVVSNARAFQQVATYPIHTFNPAVFGLPGEGVTSLGYLHISEGIAKAVEEIQRTLTGEPGPSIGRSQGSRFAARTPPELFERYYLTRYIFARALEDQGLGRASAEEFILLSELSLMADPLVLLYEQPEQLREALLKDMPGYPFDTNPFNTFLNLLNVYVNAFRRLPHLETGWGQAEANALQDAILAEARLDVTVAQLTSRLSNYVRVGLQQLGPSEGFPLADLPSLYHETFVRLLDWRAGALTGGSPLGHLLASPHQVVEMAEACVPAVVIGASILSSAGAFRPGEGVGVDMVLWQTWCQAVMRLLTGDAPCRLHIETPRSCAIPPWQLCSGIDGWRRGGPARCIQEQAVTGVMGLSRVSGLRWTDRDSHT